MSKIILPSVVSLTVLLTGCMSGWNRGMSDSSSLNSYLNQQAAQSKPAAKSSTMPETEKPKQHELAKSESSDVSLAKKLEARLAGMEGKRPAESAPKATTYAARVEALSLPADDKQQILTEFASASDAQWEELLSKLEPVFGPKPQAVANTEPSGSADVIDQYASKLVQQHLKAPTEGELANEQPKRLPSINMHQDTSHLAQVDPAGYPRTIDLDRGKMSAGARATAPPEEKIRRDTGVQLAAYVPEMDAHSEGLFPEDVQAAAIADMKRDPRNLPDKTAGPKPKTTQPETNEESVSQLTRVEYRAMQILWQRSQLSLEALHKEYKAQYASEQSRATPDPSIISLDELHAILFDLKNRGWIADTRRGNTVVYWAARNQEETDTGSWEKLIDDTIGKLERVATDTRASDEERTIAQLRLRMLYLIANRKSDAMEKVEGLTAEEQEVWSNTLFGLADYMKVEDIPVDRRHTLALGSFRRAMSHLEAASPLELRNLEFIQSVDSFGQFKPFPSHDFQPKQEVLLYVEIENFTSRDNGGKFETSLQSNYEIYDQSGRRIDARQFPEVKDSCRVRRRDFYVPYRLYMPENIPSGTYRLELTVRDSAADKFGQASIEFNIK